ncbi:hypothetical protein, partial [Paracoccus sp. (in: a-proteobacteria)]|uniref:hypothetical protein n=1 Tax=Paracoccus sp. TaxID=267 RepID=UPI00396CC5BA
SFKSPLALGAVTHVAERGVWDSDRECNMVAFLNEQTHNLQDNELTFYYEALKRRGSLFDWL